MSLEAHYQKPAIRAPHDSDKILRAMAPPHPQVVIPSPANPQSELKPPGKSASRQNRGLYGMRLVWRGLLLLGITLGISTLWFVWAWVTSGRLPLASKVNALGHYLAPILPPPWLDIMVVPLGLLALFVMLVGSQDLIRKRG